MKLVACFPYWLKSKGKAEVSYDSIGSHLDMCGSGLRATILTKWIDHYPEAFYEKFVHSPIVAIWSRPTPI